MSGSTRFTFDTNLLFYASDGSAGDKHRRALALTESAITYDCLLTLQSLGELASAMIKRRVASPSRVQQIVRAYRISFPVVPAVEADVEAALLAHEQHNIPFWDAMLWATARRAHCSVIFSEDFQDGQVLGGVTIRNPFAPGFNLDAL